MSALTKHGTEDMLRTLIKGYELYRRRAAAAAAAIGPAPAANVQGQAALGIQRFPQQLPLQGTHLHSQETDDVSFKGLIVRFI